MNPGNLSSRNSQTSITRDCAGGTPRNLYKRYWVQSPVSGQWWKAPCRLLQIKSVKRCVRAMGTKPPDPSFAQTGIDSSFLRHIRQFELRTARVTTVTSSCSNPTTKHLPNHDIWTKGKGGARGQVMGSGIIRWRQLKRLLLFYFITVTQIAASLRTKPAKHGQLQQRLPTRMRVRYLPHVFHVLRHRYR